MSSSDKFTQAKAASHCDLCSLAFVCQRPLLWLHSIGTTARISLLSSNPQAIRRPTTVTVTPDLTMMEDIIGAPTVHVLRPHHVGLLSIILLTFREGVMKNLPLSFALSVFRILLNEVAEVINTTSCL